VRDGGGTGDAALDRLESARFELVLLDAEMPDMTGVELTRAIRLAARCPPPAIVMLVSAQGAATRRRPPAWMPSCSSPSAGRSCARRSPRRSRRRPPSREATSRPRPLSEPGARWAHSAVVLLVEDNEINQRVAARMLEKHGLESTWRPTAGSRSR
jgi:CheY-like chemotaxis protein